MRRLSWLLPALALAGCVQPQTGALEQSAGGPSVTAIAVNALPGWATDDTAAALAAFVQSCKAIMLMPADQSLGGAGMTSRPKRDKPANGAMPAPARKLSPRATAPPQGSFSRPILPPTGSTARL